MLPISTDPIDLDTIDQTTTPTQQIIEVISTMAAGIAPLTNTQKIFLQRLLAQHVLTDEKARELFASINEGFGNTQNVRNDEFDRTLGKINASLVPAFNLEICTVSLPSPYTKNTGDDNANDKTPSTRIPLTKYHAIVNRSNDGIAKTNSFPNSRGSNGPHEMAYVRLLIERIIERGSMLLENSRSSNAYPAVGCPGAMNRMEIINLRTELEGAHQGHVTIAQAEMMLGLLVEEGWLVRMAPPSFGGSQNEDDDDDDADEDDEEGNETRKPRRTNNKRKTPAKKGGTFYGIGPRCFMELGEFLMKAGLPENRLPQSILHRA